MTASSDDDRERRRQYLQARCPLTHGFDFRRCVSATRSATGAGVGYSSLSAEPSSATTSSQHRRSLIGASFATER
jgi:hypothetical protein